MMWRIVSALFLAILLVLPADAQPVASENPLAPLDTASPRATLQSFLDQARRIEAAYVDYRQDKTSAGQKKVIAEIYRISELFDLSQVSGATRRELRGRSFALLYDILLRLPEIPGEALPGGPEFDPEKAPARVRLPGTAIEIVRMAEGPRAGAFLFSATTVARLPEFHGLIIDKPPIQPSRVASWRDAEVRFTGPFFPADLVAALPQSFHTLVFGTPAWKVAITMALVVAVFALTLLWRRIAIGRMGKSPVTDQAWALTVPFVFAGLLTLAVRFGKTQVNTSGLYAEAMQTFVVFAFYLAAALAIWRACFLVAEWVISTPTIPDQSYNAHLIRLLARVLSLGGAATMIVFGANFIGLPALGVLGGLGVGGIAVALAAQATIENLFGGLTFFADRPFRVGDFIAYSGGMGTVETIGPRSTRIRGLDNTLTSVPNASLAKLEVKNYAARSKFLFRHTIGLRLETTPEQLNRFKAAVIECLTEHPLVERGIGLPRALVVALGAYAIEIEVWAYVLAGKFDEFLIVQDELLAKIVGLVEETGTALAYPRQTIFLAQENAHGARAP